MSEEDPKPADGESTPAGDTPPAQSDPPETVAPAFGTPEYIEFHRRIAQGEAVKQTKNILTRVDTLESFSTEEVEEIGALTAGGMEHKEAVRRVRVDKMLNAQSSPSPVAAVSETEVTTPPTVEGQRSELEAALSGVPENIRAEVETALKAKPGLSGTDLIAELSAEVSRHLSRPSPDAASTPQVVSTPTSTETEAMQSEFDEKMKALTQGDVHGMTALKQEYRRKGLDVF